MRVMKSRFCWSWSVDDKLMLNHCTEYLLYQWLHNKPERLPTSLEQSTYRNMRMRMNVGSKMLTSPFSTTMFLYPSLIKNNLHLEIEDGLSCAHQTQVKKKDWNMNSFHNKMEKAMATLSSTLAWKIPWMEEPGRLQSMGSRRVGHDWGTSLSPFTFHFYVLEKEMATHSSVLAWRIPARAEPGGLPSMGSHRVGHD